MAVPGLHRLFSRISFNNSGANRLKYLINIRYICTIKRKGPIQFIDSGWHKSYTDEIYVRGQHARLVHLSPRALMFVSHCCCNNNNNQSDYPARAFKTAWYPDPLSSIRSLCVMKLYSIQTTAIETPDIHSPYIKGSYLSSTVYSYNKCVVYYYCIIIFETTWCLYWTLADKTFPWRFDTYTYNGERFLSALAVPETVLCSVSGIPTSNRGYVIIFLSVNRNILLRGVVEYTGLYRNVFNGIYFWYLGGMYNF